MNRSRVVEYARVKPFVEEWVQEPTTMPWGNRSILFRDPAGNLVNLFTPVTEEAIHRFSNRTRPTAPRGHEDLAASV